MDSYYSPAGVPGLAQAYSLQTPAVGLGVPPAEYAAMERLEAVAPHTTAVSPVNYAPSYTHYVPSHFATTHMVPYYSPIPQVVNYARPAEPVKKIETSKVSETFQPGQRTPAYGKTSDIEELHRLTRQVHELYDFLLSLGDDAKEIRATFLTEELRRDINTRLSELTPIV